MGVCHPLSYADDGDVLKEDEAVVQRRLDLIREAGVEWVTCDIPFPFEGSIGHVSQAFRNFLALASRWNKAGFKVLGVTPYPAGFEGGWKINGGAPGSPKFLGLYEEACRFLAQEFRGAVQAWQIANQLNLERFRRPLTEEQAIEFMKRGGAGVKAGNGAALAGVNMFGFDRSALRMYARLYPNDAVDFDYVGTNGFFGTFDPGGPKSWHEKLALLHEATAKPIIVLEFGYPSRGGVMVPAERAGGRSHHDLKKLPFVWRGGHTPEAQAAYLEEAYWAFMNTPTVLGAFWFCWSDRPKCWNCGAPDCPAGTAHGLVDVNEVPKPAYYAFSRASGRRFDLGAIYPDQPAFSDADLGRAQLELGRKMAENEALQARISVLKRMVDLRERKLERLHGSPVFRMYSLLMRPFMRLVSRGRKASSPVHDDE